MRPTFHVITAYATTDDDSIALAQAGVAGTSLALSGTLGGTMDTPRTVTITSAADESDNIFVIRGKLHGHDVIEAVRGADTDVVESVNVFDTITSITPKIATSGNVSAGTLASVPTPWVPLDHDPASEFNVGLNAVVTGSLATGYRLQAYQGKLGYLASEKAAIANEFDLIHPIDVTKIMDITSGGNPATTSSFGQMVKPATAVRLLCLESLGAGEQIVFEVLQAK